MSLSEGARWGGGGNILNCEVQVKKKKKIGLSILSFYYFMRFQPVFEKHLFT